MNDIAEVTVGAATQLTFLLDVDNTLLDNDRLKADIGTRVEALVGRAEAERFWSLYEQVRAERDYVDYPTTAARFAGTDERVGADLRALLEGIDFAQYLYPQSLAVIAHLQEFGPAVILSDGDQVFQALKIKNSGLGAAVHGRVLIYVHKEEELPKVFEAYPARHYVTVDDKGRILAALERCCPTTFTTIQVMQGHYAFEEQYTPRPDYVVDSIGDLLGFTREEFLQGAHGMASD